MLTNIQVQLDVNVFEAFRVFKTNVATLRAIVLLYFVLIGGCVQYYISTGLKAFSASTSLHIPYKLERRQPF